MSIGNRIRSLRTAQGLSQEALARKADLSLNLVHKLERGLISDPHYSTLVALADALGMPSIGELLEETVPLGEAPEAGPQEDAEPGASSERSLPRRLRELRAQQGLALREAAERIGIGWNTLRGIELGTQRVRYPTLAKIADGYAVSVEELLGGSAAEPAGKDDSPSQELARLARRYLARTPSDAKRIETLERAAGILEAYVRRWNAELASLTEKDEYPYGKGAEMDLVFQRIAEAFNEELLLPYADWVVEAGSEAVSGHELAASKRLREAAKSMDAAVKRAVDTERQMRPDRGEVDQGLADLLESTYIREGAG